MPCRVTRERLAGGAGRPDDCPRHGMGHVPLTFGIPRPSRLLAAHVLIRPALRDMSRDAPHRPAKVSPMSPKAGSRGRRRAPGNSCLARSATPLRRLPCAIPHARSADAEDPPATVQGISSKRPREGPGHPPPCSASRAPKKNFPLPPFFSCIPLRPDVCIHVSTPPGERGGPAGVHTLHFPLSLRQPA
jgi:hypothetical protein